MRIKTRSVVLDTESISKNINNRCDTQQKTWAASGGSRGNGRRRARVETRGEEEGREGGGEGGREGSTVNRGTIGENAIRNSTSLARQTPIPPRAPSPRWIIRRSFNRPTLPRSPLTQIPVPPRAALASLVDEFRVCCQSLFRAIISQHFDMTYKPAAGGGEGWLPPLANPVGSRSGGGEDVYAGRSRMRQGEREGGRGRIVGGRRYPRAPGGCWRVYSR